MKLATLKNGTRDGQLLVVKRDLSAWARAAHIAPTLQAALDSWTDVEPKLRALAAELEAGTAKSEPYDAARLLAPLPRPYEWVDGSAYLNHVRLVRKARKAEIPPSLETDPLVYQGGTSEMVPPTGDIAVRDEGPHVAVSVTDRGAGISAENRAQLMQRFFRPDRGRGRNSGGFGLGLSITKAYMRVLGGDLRYVPAEPHGSTFQLRLPKV